MDVTHTDYKVDTRFRCAQSIINSNLRFRRRNRSANTRPSNDISNYWNYSKTEILRFFSHILPDVITIFSDHLEMCYMDANMQRMRTLRTRDKQDFVHGQKHSLLVAAVKSRTVTVARVLNGTDMLRKTVRMLIWGLHRPMYRLANVKSLEANDENGFKVLIFQTY